MVLLSYFKIISFYLSITAGFYFSHLQINNVLPLYISQCNKNTVELTGVIQPKTFVSTVLKKQKINNGTEFETSYNKEQKSDNRF